MRRMIANPLMEGLFSESSSTRLPQRLLDLDVQLSGRFLRCLSDVGPDARELQEPRSRDPVGAVPDLVLSADLRDDDRW